MAREAAAYTGVMELTGMTEPMVQDGLTTDDWFLVYVKHIRSPTLN